jgi:hypothetical protein
MGRHRDLSYRRGVQAIGGHEQEFFILQEVQGADIHLHLVPHQGHNVGKRVFLRPRFLENFDDV